MSTLRVKMQCLENGMLGDNYRLSDEALEQLRKKLIGVKVFADRDSNELIGAIETIDGDDAVIRLADECSELDIISTIYDGWGYSVGEAQ